MEFRLFQGFAFGFLGNGLRGHDKDVIKLVILYLLHHGLMGTNNRKLVLDCFLILADGLDAFNCYTWAYMAWNSMTDLIRKKV